MGFRISSLGVGRLSLRCLRWAWRDSILGEDVILTGCRDCDTVVVLFLSLQRKIDQNQHVFESPREKNTNKSCKPHHIQNQLQKHR